MPLYVDPNEETRPAADRQEIFERLLLISMAFSSAVVGGMIGRFTSHRVDIDAIDDGKRQTES